MLLGHEVIVKAMRIANFSIINSVAIESFIIWPRIQLRIEGSESEK
jgi:hypothetical protein